ncbi:hypothetical protein [uncultured Muribaculum sp.]|uniref:hypothetical protein n=1 Tax=uncultured Muribaculum sp. TaxID=1918613 RepID=UPI002606E9BF|nr:hypothetical protein [uncultured Muribaculum sp.]
MPQLSAADASGMCGNSRKPDNFCDLPYYQVIIQSNQGCPSMRRHKSPDVA